MRPKFEGFGLALGEVVQVRHLDWEVPDRGLVALCGRGAPEIAQLLARRVQPEDAWTWGALTYSGIDWRVRPPAALIDAASAPLAGSVLSNLRYGVPAREILATLEGADAADHGANWARALAARYGVEALDLDVQAQALEHEAQLEVMLLSALARRPRVLLIEASCVRAGPAPIWTMLERASLELPIVIYAERWPDGLPRPEEVVDLGARGVVCGPGRAERPCPERPPSWFRWFLPQRLGGMPRPGRSEPREASLHKLERLGVSHVLSLESEHPPVEGLEAHGIVAWHFPIDDMEVPSPEDAARWCERVEEALERDARVAIHCRAGIGRTGTMAALLLMRRGYTLSEALMLLRSWNRFYVQSQAQLDFLKAIA